MTTKSLIAIAAALTAALAVNTAPASAGGGVRLGFGGPLISFVARETLNHAMRPRHHGYDRPAYHAPRSYAERPTYKKHAAQPQKKQVAKSSEQREEKVAKKDTDETVKQLATNAIPLETSASPAPTAAQSTSAPQVLKLDSTAVGETTQPKAETAATEAAKPEAKVESAALTPTADNKPANVPDTKAKTAKTTEKKSDCRRFVPSAGITISIRCND